MSNEEEKQQIGVNKKVVEDSDAFQIIDSEYEGGQKLKIIKRPESNRAL